MRQNKIKVGQILLMAAYTTLKMAGFPPGPSGNKIQQQHMGASRSVSSLLCIGPCSHSMNVKCYRHRCNISDNKKKNQVTTCSSSRASLVTMAAVSSSLSSRSVMVVTLRRQTSTIWVSGIYLNITPTVHCFMLYTLYLVKTEFEPRQTLRTHCRLSCCIKGIVLKSF